MACGPESIGSDFCVTPLTQKWIPHLIGIIIIFISRLSMPDALTQAAEDLPNSNTAPSSASTVQAISSEAILAGRPYALIEHGGALYWLRATRSGKLILTK